jgi:uncharacterized glyoxalase superfamily protein PhnB
MSLSVVLTVKDVAKSMTFYLDTLGLESLGDNGTLPGPDGKPVFGAVAHEGSQIMLSTELAEGPLAGMPGAGVQVYIMFSDKQKDIDAYYAGLKAKGVAMYAELADKFWGERGFIAIDPDGYHLHFAKQVRDVSEAEMIAASKENRTN